LNIALGVLGGAAQLIGEQADDFTVHGTLLIVLETEEAL
jgi:hypothetical protein